MRKKRKDDRERGKTKERAKIDVFFAVVDLPPPCILPAAKTGVFAGGKMHGVGEEEGTGIVREQQGKKRSQPGRERRKDTQSGCYYFLLRVRLGNLDLYFFPP